MLVAGSTSQSTNHQRYYLVSNKLDGYVLSHSAKKLRNQAKLARCSRAKKKDGIREAQILLTIPGKFLQTHRWLLGSGTDTNPGAAAAAAASLNTVNPPPRDDLHPNTWIAFRFVANSLGAWLLHYHIPFHMGMDQNMALAEEPEKISAAPARMPECPSPCS